MAVTHADLAPRQKETDLGSKTGITLMVISIFFGLFCFILCLIAEATRSQMIREASDDGGGEKSECRYSGSGKVPLMCAVGAFLSLAIAMVIEHGYMLMVVSKSNPPALINLDPDISDYNSLTCQAAFFFITTWICFSVGEILLLIGLSIESGHLKDWMTPRAGCLIIRQGLFSSAGVLGLVTVFLASGLYITALQAQWIMQDLQNVRSEVLEASVLYSSPPRSPRHRIVAIASENPTVWENAHNRPHLIDYLMAFDKSSPFSPCKPN